MKIGDIISDKFGTQWIIIEDVENAQKLFIVMDFLTHTFETAINFEDIDSYESIPENVSWLFMARNKKMKKAVGE